MDIASTKNKEVIKGTKINGETVYYSALFGLGFIIAVVLLILGIIGHNTGLIVYTAILIPLFLAASLASIRFTMISKDTLYIEDGYLVVKRFFTTVKMKTSDISKLTAVKDDKSDAATINITYGKETAKFHFRSLTKEEIAQLKRATSKY